MTFTQLIGGVAAVIGVAMLLLGIKMIVSRKAFYPPTLGVIKPQLLFSGNTAVIFGFTQVLVAVVLIYCAVLVFSEQTLRDVVMLCLFSLLFHSLVLVGLLSVQRVSSRSK